MGVNMIYVANSPSQNLLASFVPLEALLNK